MPSTDHPRRVSGRLWRESQELEPRQFYGQRLAGTKVRESKRKELGQLKFLKRRGS
ncbi:MAG: hypothetical protein M3410_03005 [Acidobacteriota bacterium]|nr:hypothetical protein [Acidobacteriota bacterium]